MIFLTNVLYLLMNQIISVDALRIEHAIQILLLVNVELATLARSASFWSQRWTP